MKILLTGMSALQASSKANSRTLSFAGVVNKTLINCGHEVHWLTPDVTWSDEYLNAFDAVIVGITPITSLSANYCYGGLHVIERLLNSSKLTLLIDAPQVSQITASLNAILAKPENLTKPFYSKRKGFNKAVDDAVKSKFLSVIDRLASSQWPVTIYPKLPWGADTMVTRQLPEGAAKSLTGLNLDAELFTSEPVTLPERSLKWAVDSQTGPWYESVAKTLLYPISPMRWNKGSTDEFVHDQIARSIGALIVPQRYDGTWWSYRYVQAMNSYTPVASFWQETQATGSSWAVLAATIETASQDERDAIALNQRSEYLRSIPSTRDARIKLETTLRITENKEN